MAVYYIQIKTEKVRITVQKVKNNPRNSLKLIYVLFV